MDSHALNTNIQAESSSEAGDASLRLLLFTLASTGLVVALSIANAFLTI